MSLFQQKYPNSIRTVAGLINVPFQDDVVLECDTTLSPVGIQLQTIPANYWSTQYKLYIVDKSNNASVNNIVITAPLGYKINGLASITINVNGGSCLIRVIGNTNYVSQYSSATSGGYSTIQDEGIALPSRPIINFVGGGIVATDDAINNRTNVAIGTPATVWNDILNLNYYNYALSTASGILPQYAIEGNRITFRGILFVPLDGYGSANYITNGNSYRDVGNAVLDTSGLNVSEVVNSNGDTLNGRQGIFITGNTSTSKNLPPIATPIARDINFTNVIATRRFVGVIGSPVVLYRSLVNLRITSQATPLNSSLGAGIGCLALFSPLNEELGGFDNSPIFSNDPLALLISRVTGGQPTNNYITATDDSPFTIPPSANVNPFSCNAHVINSLGGFFINLEGLTGYLN
jgi:hypothetical protein